VGARDDDSSDVGYEEATQRSSSRVAIERSDFIGHVCLSPALLPL
jgi:hypothetical protein